MKTGTLWLRSLLQNFLVHSWEPISYLFIFLLPFGLLVLCRGFQVLLQGSKEDTRLWEDIPTLSCHSRASPGRSHR